MIIVGYQGIGKSSIVKSHRGFIDLESSNFFVDGKRADNWYVVYCNIANHLSEQGYSVFMSSHEVVRSQLKHSKQRKLIICPSLALKDEWIDRLQKRYDLTQIEKDYKALMNAVDRYSENIQELLSEDGFEKIVIDDIDYKLEDLLNSYPEYFVR